MTREVSPRQDGNAHDLVGDESPDPHHRRPSVVQLDAALVHLGGGAELVPSEVQRAVAVIPDELGGLLVEPVGVAIADLGHDEERAHLHEDVHPVLGIEESLPGAETVGDALGAGEAYAGGRHEVSDDGEHGDTSVLDLLLAQVVEGGLIALLEESEGVEEAELR